MSLSKVGGSGPGGSGSSAELSTTSEAASHGPNKAATSPALQSLRGASRAGADAGAGMARRTGVLALAAFSDLLMPVAEAGYHPATGAAAAAGARHAHAASNDGSETAEILGIALGATAGAAAAIYAGVKAYRHFAGKNAAEPAVQGPAAVPAGNVNNL